MLKMWSVPRRYHGHWEEEEEEPSSTSSQPRRMRARRMKLSFSTSSSGDFGAIWSVTVLAAILVALICGPHQVAAVASSRRTMLAMASDRGNSLLHEPATDCRLGMNKRLGPNFFIRSSYMQSFGETWMMMIK